MARGLPASSTAPKTNPVHRTSGSGSAIPTACPTDFVGRRWWAVTSGCRRRRAGAAGAGDSHRLAGMPLASAMLRDEQLPSDFLVGLAVGGLDRSCLVATAAQGATAS